MVTPFPPPSTEMKRSICPFNVSLTSVRVCWSEERAAATLEIRDRIVYKDEEETKVSNDWSLAFGLSLVLGG